MNQSSEADRDAGEDRVSTAVIRAFHPDEFIEWDSWRRLVAILETNGGSYGVAGPRGSGKSWLMQRAVRWAEEHEGLGLWFPSPSNYSPVAFLSALSENFASEVQRLCRRGAPRWYDRFASVPWFVVAVLLAVAAAYSFTSPFAPVSPVLSGPLFAGGLLAMSASALGLSRREADEVTLFSQATALRERIRFSEARRTTTQASARLKGASMKSSQERDLTERTFHLASLVQELRILMASTARTLRRPVVVAIDELDKIHDPEEARKLLRDIKGIFEVEGVHFLVSVSSEAQRTLHLGAVRGRDEFQSSFPAVVEMERRSPIECADLLFQRTRERPIDYWAALALGILGEGNPREVVRLADLVLARYPDLSEPPEGGSTRRTTVHCVLESEVRAFATELLGSPLADAIKGEAHRALPYLDGRRPDEDDLERAPDELWTLIGGEDQQHDGLDEKTLARLSEDYVEPWRRLLVRLAIDGLITTRINLSRQELEWLQHVAITATSSASVARDLLGDESD